MRQVVVLLFIVASSCAMNVFVDEDAPLDPLDPFEPFEDEPNEMDFDQLGKRAVCDDKATTARCRQYKQFCSRSANIRKYCSLTCGECTPSPQQSCVDKDNRCHSWTSYCNRDAWVARNCKKTCGQCSRPATRPPPRPRPTARPTVPPCNPNKIEPRSCATWKSNNFCKRSSKYFDYMKKTCPGTCGLCKGYKPPAPAKPQITKFSIADCLDAHNMYRRRHGAQPLTWDVKMARQAEQYALKLAAIKKMKHDQSIRGIYGENLAMSWSSGDQKYSCDDATKAWYDEVKDYSYSNPVFHQNTGHFTQVVWKASRKLGVGIARNGNYIFVVARYSPPGNFRGQFAQNVGRPV